MKALKRTFSAWRFGDKVPGLAPWGVFRRGFAAENVARLRLSQRFWFCRENIRTWALQQRSIQSQRGNAKPFLAKTFALAPSAAKLRFMTA